MGMGSAGAGLFETKPIIGMIHMPALPGAPRNDATMEALIGFALSETRKLESSGLDGVIVENAGDSPFFRQRVPPITVAAMATIVREVRTHTRMRVGVNVLRNCCEAALSIAHAAGAEFIRCNVVIGAYVTDQGIIQGCAAELARLRRSLNPGISVLGDVHVKHASPLFNVPIEDAAKDLAERGGVDAVIVSGRRSPDPPSSETLALVSQAVELPVLVGSGIDLGNVGELYECSGGIVLGEVDFKIGRKWGGAGDEAAYARAVGLCRPTTPAEDRAGQRKPSRGSADTEGRV
ncbi:MAG: BtpA/SgcQ family protein [Actinomycetota bacterium]